MSIDIDSLTIGQAKELAALLGNTTPQAQVLHFFEIGKNYIVRTVTMIYTGKLVDVGPQEIVLIDAAWIPETDRFMQFVADCAVKECEPYPDGRRVIIGRGALVDAVVLEKDLPRSQR
jgi:hypothetical protein